MTELIQGTLKRVFNKEMPEDQWGNNTRLSIAISPDTGGDDVWVSLGTAKRPGLTVKIGKDWETINEGSKIVVVAERNGDFLNAKRADVKVLSKAGDAPKAAPKNTSQGKSQSYTRKGTASGGPDWEKKDAGAAASASVDKALVLLQAVGYLHSGKDNGWDKEVILDTARTMQEIVVELANEIQFGKDSPPPTEDATPSEKPSPRKKAPVQAEDFEDDDVPF